MVLIYGQRNKKSNMSSVKEDEMTRGTGINSGDIGEIQYLRIMEHVAICIEAEERKTIP